MGSDETRDERDEASPDGLGDAIVIKRVVVC